MPPKLVFNRNNNPIGIAWALLCSFFWSTTFVVARYLLLKNAIDPMSMSAVRFLGGGIVMLCWGLISYGKDVFPASGDLLILAGLGLFGMAGMSTLLFYGQQTTTAINSAIILEAMPILLNILIAYFLGDILTSFHIVGLSISLFGTLVVTGVLSLEGFCFTKGLRGDFLVFSGSLCCIANSFMGKKVVERLGSFRTTTWAMVFGGLEMLLVLQFRPNAFINWPLTWPWLIYLAVFPTAVAFFGWFKGMELITWSLLNIIQCLTPVFTIIIAWIFLNERLGWLKAIGAVLVVVGIIIAGRKPGVIEEKEHLSAKISN